MKYHEIISHRIFLISGSLSENVFGEIPTVIYLRVFPRHVMDVLGRYLTEGIHNSSGAFYRFGDLQQTPHCRVTPLDLL